MKDFLVRNTLNVSCGLLFWSWFWYFVEYESIEAVIAINLISAIGIIIAVITDLEKQEIN